MSVEWDRIQECTRVIRDRVSAQPRVGIILGTGLGALADDIEVEHAISYEDIPHFGVPTVESHSGRLLFGILEGQPIVAMQGRFHMYEGHSVRDVTRPIRVMGQLGAETLVVSGAVGGMNPLWGRGDLVVLDDHINLLGDNPLVGENIDALGPRFPDMSEPYDRALQEVTMAAALHLSIPLRRGVYAAVVGPNLETRAEYRMLRGMGADVVGMSTVPEVIVARHMGMKVLGLCIITDQCLPDALEEADIDTIIATAMEAEPKLKKLIRAVIARI